MIDLNKVDWESIVISAIENPQNQTANFEELKDLAIGEIAYFSKDKIIYETEKVKLMLRIGWDKNKFFFRYESVVIDKRSNKRVLGVDEAHGNRHLHSGKFIIPNPTTLIEKLEHPILSLIIRSEPENRKKEWIRRLANELKNSQINWRNYLRIK
jgi:hypothetical protein